MNDVVRAILERRSVRSYKQDPIPDDILKTVVNAGLYAPSARNIQPWHITVIKDTARIDRVTEEVKAAIIRCDVERYLGMAKSSSYRVNFGAPVFMVVSADPASTRTPVEDCSLVLGTMFLAAHSLGVGSCWVNQLGPVCDDPGFRRLLDELGVPSANKIYGSAAFGYNAGDHPAVPARKKETVNVVE